MPRGNSEVGATRGKSVGRNTVTKGADKLISTEGERFDIQICHGDDVNKPTSEQVLRGKWAQPSRFDEESVQNIAVESKRKKGVRQIEQVDPEITLTRFVEDGDEVVIEVCGQATEFQDEPAMQPQADNMANENRNAQRDHDEDGELFEDVEAKTKMLNKAAEIQEQEEAEMQKFMDFMKKKGLVMVDLESVKSQQQQPLQEQQKLHKVQEQQQTVSQQAENRKMQTVE